MKMFRFVPYVVCLGVLFGPEVQSACVVDQEYGPLFERALIDLEKEVEQQVRDGLDEIGLPALGNSLSLSSLLDLKASVTDKLFASNNRTLWFGDLQDLSMILQNNINNANLPGPPTVIVNCPVVEQQLEFAVSLKGVAYADPSSPALGILPSPLPELSIDLDQVEVHYGLDLGFIVDLEFNTFSLGNTQVTFAFALGGGISQALPILPTSADVIFSGTFGLGANFGYSSISKWTYSGSYTVNTTATTSGIVADLALLASDDNIFDAVPPSVRFDFDVCAIKENIKTAISSVTLGNGVLDTLLAKHLDLTDNELLGNGLVDSIKTAIVGAAEAEMNSIKTNIVSKIDAISCSSDTTRRTVEMEIGGDGRMLQAGSNFDFLTNEIAAIGFVESADAGYFAGRNEVALDLVIKVEEALDKNDFKTALEAVFGKLDDAKALFGAGPDAVADVNALMVEVNALASFHVAMSIGMKVGDMASFFSGSGSVPIDELFIRLDALSVKGEANASNLTAVLFPAAEVSIDGGALAVSAGICLAEPVEAALKIDGSLKSEITFDQALTGRFQFEPTGHLFATLPLSASVGGEDWKLGVIFEDDNLFEAPEVAVKVDFDACKIADVLQLLLAKLGSLSVSAQGVLGPSVPFSGIDLSTVIGSIDDVLPNVGTYMDGVLEANNELFHLCREAEEFGTPPPSLEDVIALIQEDVFTAKSDGDPQGSERVSSRRLLRSHHLPHTRSSRHQRHRGLRASHLPHTRYTRPRALRSRHLNSVAAATDLIDSLTVEGGFDGSMIYVRLSVDVSREGLDFIDELIVAPLEQISGADFLTKIFSSGDNSTTAFMDTVTLETDYSAGAHLTAVVGFEIPGADLANIASFSASEIASRAFIQFEDVSAKFTASAKASGSVDIAGISTLNLNEGSIAIAFGIGIEESSARIYFPQISSAAVSLRQEAPWQKVGAVDISLPIALDLPSELPDLSPIITITDQNLFDTDPATVTLDFDIRALVDDGEDLVAKIMNELSGGLIDISNGTVPTFDIGPLENFGGKIEGILDKFGLDLGQIVSEFKTDYTTLKDNIDNQTSFELEEIINMKPKSLPKFGNLLQIGSKKPSPQLSLELRQRLWDKLVSKFPSYLYNGVPVPGLPMGQSFEASFPVPGDFPVRDFLPALAVAYDKATSFSDVRAKKFSMDDLFTPEFGPALSLRLLEKLKMVPSFGADFGRFDSFDPITGLPMISLTKELFDVRTYALEIQVALQLAPSTDLAASGFAAKDIQEALFPFALPSISSFSSFVKRLLIPKIASSLDFEVPVDSVSGGLTSSTPKLSASGLDFGSFNNRSTRMFPPSIDLDDIQSFDFDLMIDIADGGALSLEAKFVVNLKGVNPASVLQNAADTLNAALLSVESEFEGTINADGLASGFSNAGNFLARIADIDQLTLALDATIDFSVGLDLSTSNFAVSSVVRALTSALEVRVEDSFNMDLEGFDVAVAPAIVLNLAVENTAVPFDLFAQSGLASLHSFDFAGSLASRVIVTVDGVPASVTFGAAVPDITNASSIDFDMFVDIDLYPIREAITDLLDGLDLIKYPEPVQEFASFLPVIDISCIKTSGQTFLSNVTTNGTATHKHLPVSSFFDAIAEGCSGESVAFSGGYDTNTSELAMNIVVDVGTTRTLLEIVKGLKSVIGKDLSLASSFYDALSMLGDDISIEGNFHLDVSVGVRGLSSDKLGTDSYGTVEAFIDVNKFDATAAVTGTDLSLDFPVRIPQPGTSPTQIAALSLNGGSFYMGFSVASEGAIEVASLFGANQTSDLVFQGVLDFVLPVEAVVNEDAFGLTLLVQDQDLFDSSAPVLAYELDICAMKNATAKLFNGLTTEVTSVLEAELQLPDLAFNLSEVTDPLVEHARSSLNSLTDEILSGLDQDCSSARRRLQANSTSFVNKVTDALEAMKSTLAETGIEIDFAAVPGFDTQNFIAGLDIDLGISITLSGLDVLNIVQRFLGDATSAGNVETLGLNATNGAAGLSLDPFQLLNDTVISAGFGIRFGVEVDMKAIQEGSDDIGDAILEGLVLRIDSWGAHASLIVDPIELQLDNGDTAISVRDSSFALGVDVRSLGSFAASVTDMLNSDADVSGLMPTVEIPLNVELTFDLAISDFTVSPMLQLTKPNVLDGFTFSDFVADVDLGVFLESDSFEGLTPIFQRLDDLIGNISAYGPELNMGDTPTAVKGLFDTINQASEFAGALQQFVTMVEQVDSLIPSQIRSVVNNLDLLSLSGCTNPSVTVTQYTFDLLMAEANFTSADFDSYNPCDYLPEIQAVLGFSSSVSVDQIDLQSLVVIPDDLNATLIAIYGYELDSQSVFELFRSKSLRRLLSFTTEYLASTGKNPAEGGRRRLLLDTSSSVPLVGSGRPSLHRKRLDLVRDVRGSGNTMFNRHRRRNLGETTIATLPVGDYLDISFGFNFGDGKKEIFVTADFDFDADDSAADSIKGLFQGFIGDTLGSDSKVSSQFAGSSGNGISFQQHAAQITSSLVQSIIVDASVDIGVTFGLNLTDLFDSDSLQSLPKPFLQIDNFDVVGAFGVKEWNAKLDLAPGVTFEISEASAIVSAGVSLGQPPLLIDSPVEFSSLVGPSSDPSAAILLSANVTVDLPMFATVSGVGIAATVEYTDQNLLDNIKSEVKVRTDLVFAIEGIQSAAELLRDETSFLSDFDAFSSDLPLIGESVNDVVVGEGNTIDRLFNWTDWAAKLSATTDGTSPGYITKTELLKELRSELQGLFFPATPDVNDLPAPPDVGTFQQAGFASSVARDVASVCAGNDQAISVSINDDAEEDNFDVTFCSLIGFEFGAELNTEGLMNLFDEGFVEFALSKAEFKLQGSVTVGAKLSISLDDSTPAPSLSSDFAPSPSPVEDSASTTSFKADLQLDPLVLKLAVVASPEATLGLGLLEVEAGVQALATGEFGFLYCPTMDCNNEGYVQVTRKAGNDPTKLEPTKFYFKRSVQYSFKGKAELSETLPGLDVSEALTVSIADDDVFDDVAPTVTLPDFDAFKDLIRFSPANAVALLRLVDMALVQATKSDRFDLKLPILNKTFADFLAVAKVFSERLYEFFVKVLDFEEREFKSVSIQSVDALSSKSLDQSLQFELYVIKDLTANPLPDNAAKLRAQASGQEGLCTINFGHFNDGSGANEFSFVAGVINSINDSETCNIKACPRGGSCQEISDGSKVGEIFGCDCDLVIGLDSQGHFFITSVSYKDTSKTISNDIQMLGLFQTDYNNIQGPANFMESIPINDPSTPGIVPRFTTFQQLLDRMTKVLNDFVGENTGLDFELSAVYDQGSELEPPSFLLGIEFGKKLDSPLALGFDADITIGDLADLKIGESSMELDAGFTFGAEFGVILAPDNEESLSLLGSACDGNGFVCNLPPFKFQLEWIENESKEVAEFETSQSTNATMGLQQAFVGTALDGKVTVFPVGTATLVMNFNPTIDSVLLRIQKTCFEVANQANVNNTLVFECQRGFKPSPTANLYGFSDDREKKSGFQIVIGATTIDADFSVTGMGKVSANVGGVVEAEASVEAQLSGGLEFVANEYDYLNINEFLPRLKNLTGNPGFVRALVTVDGSFEVGARVNKPFGFDVPGKFVGGFGKSSEDPTPFVLDLAAPNFALQRPDLYLDIDIPNLGDITNLSFCDVIRLLDLALEFLVGSEEGDTVDSCSGGLLGKEVFGQNIFTYRIPVVGVSACDTASFLQVIVDAGSTLMTSCDAGEEDKTTFTALELKLESLLQDGVGGTPDVKIVTTSDSVRSVLELDLCLMWSFTEVHQLQIDLATILEKLDLEGDILTFAKGLLAAEGSANTELKGGLSFCLGLGLEFFKAERQLRPFVKGITGLTLQFKVETDTSFTASVGPFSATVDANAIVDNNDDPLTIKFGLDDTLNYYIKRNETWFRPGFTGVAGPGGLVGALDVSVAGRVKGDIKVELMGGLGSADINLQIADVNNVIQGSPGAVAMVYQAKLFTPKIPSFLDLLLMEPQAIVNAVEDVFDQAEKFSIGSEGVLSKLPLPFVDGLVAKQLGANTPNNPIRWAKDAIGGVLEAVLLSGESPESASQTVADRIAFGLELALDEIGILDDEEPDGVSVAYYEHPTNGTQPGDAGRVQVPYSEEADIKSLMWTIPMGQTFRIEVPIDFELPGGFPLQIKPPERPTLTLFWKFKLAFGFDDSEGFFLYTFPDQLSEFQIVADFQLPLGTIDLNLLFFLALQAQDVLLEFGAALVVDIDKERAMRQPDPVDKVGYGRITRADFKRIPQKKQLFQISASVAGAATIGKFTAQVAENPASEWLPVLHGKLDAIIRKDINILNSSKARGRRMREIDRVWVQSRIKPTDHRALRAIALHDDHQGLRELAVDDGLIPSVDDCPLDAAKGQFFCVNVKDIELDLQKLKPLVKSILDPFVNTDQDGFFDHAMVPIEPLGDPIPGLSELAKKDITVLDIAEATVARQYPKVKKGVDTARKLIKFYKGLKKVAELLEGENVLLAKSCIFKNGGRLTCSGGVSDFLTNDGSRRALQHMQELEEMEDVFPTYDAGGNRISSQRYLQLTCTDAFKPEDKCVGSCEGCLEQFKDKCKARQLRCKNSQTSGLSFPFLSNPASAIGLLSGKDIQILDFSPPDLVFVFQYKLLIMLYTPPTVNLNIEFEFSVTLTYGVVLDSSGIRQAVQEKSPEKALNSLALKDTFDGVDLPLVTFQASINLEVAVSAAVVKISVTGGVTFRVEVDFYDPYPEESKGLIRPFQLLSTPDAPLDWFEINLAVWVTFKFSVSVGIYMGFFEITVYEFSLKKNIPILEELIQPSPPKSPAEKDASGMLQVGGAVSNPVTCQSQGGQLASEEIGCTETGTSKPSIRNFNGVKTLSSASRRRLDSLDAFDEIASRRLQLENANQYNCIQSAINLGSSPAVKLNYNQCAIDNGEIFIGGSQTLVGSEKMVNYVALQYMELALPETPAQFQVTTIGKDCRTAINLLGHTNLVVLAHEVQPGCEITAMGAELDATLTVDFGFESNAPCSNGNSVMIDQQNGGLVRITRPGVSMDLYVGSVFVDFFIRGSQCNDFLLVKSTVPGAKSAEILGGGGDDTITLGSNGAPFESSVYAKIVVDAGEGLSDTLVVIDDSTAAKTELIGSRRMSGIHADGSRGVTYSNLDFLDVYLSNGSNQLTVQSTPPMAPTSIRTGNSQDVVVVESTQSDITLRTQGGSDSVTIMSAAEDVFIDSGNGGDSITALDVRGDLEVISGSGDDTVYILKVEGNTDISTNAGADLIDISVIRGYLNLHSGDGPDVVNVLQAVEGNTLITTGQGPDVVDINRIQGNLNLDSGTEDDIITIDFVVGNIDLDSGADNDVISLFGLGAGSTGIVRGNTGDDILNVDGRGDSRNTFDGSLLRWSGGDGDDTLNTFFTSAGTSNLDIFDDLDGSNSLNIECANSSSFILSRENFLANIHDMGNPNSTLERINMDRHVNEADITGWTWTASIQSIFLALNGGENKMYFDDTMAMMDVLGGPERDEFRIGQLYNSSRGSLAFVTASDPVQTTLTTKGYLSNGNSHPVTINGEFGDDYFDVRRSNQVLDLNGGSGNDEVFVDRSSITWMLACDASDLGSDPGVVSLPTEEQKIENFSPKGEDPDYVVNSLLAMNGGTGIDQLVVVGTEQDDSYGVTDSMVIGGGLTISFANVESLELDGREGNDLISDFSTSTTTSTTIHGNKGSDHIEIAPRSVDPVVSKSLRGHRGILEHTVVSEDGDYNDIAIEGLAVDILDNDGDYGYINVVETEPVHLLFEDMDETFTFTVFPTRRPSGKLTAIINGQSDQEGNSYLMFCLNGQCEEERSILLTFEDGDMTPQVVEVKHNPNAARLGITEADLVIKSVVDVARTSDNNFKRTEQSIIPMNIKLIPGKQNPEAKSITVVEPEAKTIVAEGPHGFSAEYDIYLRPCTPEMKDDTKLEINPTVLGQVELNKDSIMGDEWGEDCKVTITVTAVDDDFEEGDHFVSLVHEATNSMGQQILLSDGSPLFVRNVLVRIYDDDSAGVVIDRPLGYLSAAEIAGSDMSLIGSPDLYQGQYRIRLSKQPSSDVSIVVTSTPTGTDRLTPSTADLNRGYTDRVQVQVNGEETVTLVFTPNNWSTWQTIQTVPIDDSIEEGVDYLHHPLQPSFLAYIKGPVAVLGAGAADVPFVGPPLRLPGEIEEPEFIPPCGAELNKGTLNVIEENQVDYLIINNQDMRGSMPAYGTLTASQLTGMNMGREIVIGGVSQLDGIYYKDMEVIEFNLGNGTDSVKVVNTSAAIHVLNLAGGNDETIIEEIAGPFIVRGEEGGDTLTVESPESKVDTIQALLSFDGGSGTGVGNSDDVDHFIIINSGDTTLDDVLNVTRSVVEVASMGFDNSSWAPARSYWINLRSATNGTFVLEVTDPLTEETTTKSVPFPIKEKELETTIQRMIIPGEIELNSCGLLGTSKCTNTVKVWSVGDDAYVVFYVGERLYDGVTMNLTQKDLDNFVPEYFQNVTNDILHQNSDVFYRNVETLDINMGDLDTVLNVRGTSATTTITTQTGDDTVFISSEANQNIENARTVDVLLGWLDYLHKDLTVNVATGRHRLLMSDEKSLIAKGRTNPAVLTRQSLTSLGNDLGDIFFNTAGSGNWSAGVDLWLGKGDDQLDVLSVPSNPGSPPFRTTTCVHANNGDDSLIVSLAEEDHDGAVFVANGQAGDDMINASLSTHPVILFGERGNDTLIGGHGDDVILGDLGRVIWRGAAEESGIFAQVGGGGYGDFTDGIIRNVSEIVSLYTEVGGKDKILTGDGDNVGIGGFDDDFLVGGNARDILFGDSAVITYHADSTSPKDALSVSCELGGEDELYGGDGLVDYLIGGGFNDTIEGNNGMDLAFGDHAYLTFHQAESHRLHFATTTNHSCSGGYDAIDLGDGDDLAFGGALSDTITGGPGQDVIFGDFGLYDSETEFLPYQNYRSNIESPEFAGGDWIHGGEDDDTIFGQEGLDVIHGGSGNDDITGGHSQRFGADTGDIVYGGPGEDVILGDNGQILRIRVSEAGFYPWVNGMVWLTYPAPFHDSVVRNVSRYDDIDYVQGDDEIHGGPGNDILHGQRGDDTIYGDDGDDELYGELGSDFLFAGNGSDILIGDIGYCVRRYDASGNPVLISDVSGTSSEAVWNKDIVLEELGNITKVTRISKKVDLSQLTASDTASASMLFVANAFTESSGKYVDPVDGEWPTDLLLFDLVPAYNDTLDAGEGGLNVLIGQRGHDFLTGGTYSDLLIGDAGKNLIPQDSDLPRIQEVYRTLSAPAGSGYEHAPNEVDFGVVFTADFEIYPSQYRYTDYLSSIIDVDTTVNGIQENSDLLKDIIGASALATDRGYCMQPMFRLTPSFISDDTQQLHGNDVIRSGTGSSIIIGDDIRGATPFDLTEIKEFDDLRQYLDNLVYDLGVRLSIMEVDNGFFEEGLKASPEVLKVASDTITTEAGGKAFVAGDFMTFYGRSLLGGPLNADQVLAMADRLRDIELTLIDVHMALYEVHQAMLLEMQASNWPDAKDDQTPQYNLTLACDHITSYGNGDILIGDSAAVFTQVDRPGDVGFEFELLVKNAPDLSDLINLRDDARDQHIEFDLDPTHVLTKTDASNLPYADVPHYLTACADVLNQTSAQNLGVGDYGFVGYVSSSQSVVAELDAYVDSMAAVVKRPGVSSFFLSPVVLKAKIPFYEERYSSQVGKLVEPFLFGDSFYGYSAANYMLGEFLNAIGSGQQSAGSSGFVFDDRARGVYNTFDNAAFAQENDGDVIISSPGSIVDGQKGKDIESGKGGKKTVTKTKNRRELQEVQDTTDPATAIPLETFAQQLFYDHVLISQWIADMYNAPVPASSFKSDGIKQPQHISAERSSFIPPDILGAPPTSRRQLVVEKSRQEDSKRHAENNHTRGANNLREKNPVVVANRDSLVSFDSSN